MAKKKTAEHSSSRREQEHAAMLKKALARPGVRQAMKVYHDWRKKDQGLDAYRSATKEPEQILTTNHTNSRQA